MTFTISKREFVYLSLIAILSIATVFSFVIHNAGAQVDQKASSDSLEVNAEELPNILPEDRYPTDIPHLSCSSEMHYGRLPYSNEYNSDIDFFAPFMGTGTQFQDINGDGLADYIYNYHNVVGSSDSITSDYRSCVYLNRGNGWDRAFICIATTKAETTTGNIVEGHYWGDCAANPNSKE